MGNILNRTIKIIETGLPLPVEFLGERCQYRYITYIFVYELSLNNPYVLHKYECIYGIP